MFKRFPKRSLFYKCLAASLTLHVTALFIALKYPHYFRLAPNPIKQDDTLKIAKNESNKSKFLRHNEDLEQALSNLIYLPQKVDELSIQDQSIPSSTVKPEKQTLSSFKSIGELLQKDPLFLQIPSKKDTDQPSKVQIDIKTLPLTSLVENKIESSISSEEIHKFLLNSSSKTTNERPIASIDGISQPISQSFSFQGSDPVSSFNQLPEPTFSSATSDSKDIEPNVNIAVSFNLQDNNDSLPTSAHTDKIAILPQLSLYDLPEGMASYDSSNDMPMQVQYARAPDGNGYIFSLTLNPQIPSSSIETKHKFYFILDRTNSIGSSKFIAYKKGIIRALKRLGKNDEFNIYVIDKDLKKFSPKELACTGNNIHKAEEYLNKLSPGAKFSAGDVYKSLAQIVPSTDDPNVFISAVFLTDGETILKSSNQKDLINKWIKANPRTALYSGAIADNNNLVLLDLLGGQAQGKVIYSDTYAAFPRKMARLINTIKEPLVPQFTASVNSSNPDLQVSFYPSKLPVMYNNHPYVILGRVNKLEDFSVLLEGRCNGQWVQIKKDISFQTASKGSKQLNNLWAVQKANKSYELFLESGDPSHLKEAEVCIKNTIQKRR